MCCTPARRCDAAHSIGPCRHDQLNGEHPLHPINPDLPARDQDGRVYLPTNNSGGQALHWTPPDDSRPTALFGLLANIVETMQNWRDQIQFPQFPYPGYRDRIVQVRQRPDEGVLNLNMPREQIERLADAGEFAADTLIQRFDPVLGQGWQNHQDVRVRSFLTLVEDLLKSASLQDAGWDGRLTLAGLLQHIAILRCTRWRRCAHWSKTLLTAAKR